MAKRWRYMIAIAGVGLVWVIVVLARPESEPEYKGKKLSEWVEGLRSIPPKPGAREALRYFGTNAVPHLVKWIQYEPATMKVMYCRLLDWFRSKPAGDSLLSDKHQLRAVACIEAFRELGSVAGDAVPDLARAANDVRASTNAGYAGLALSLMSQTVLAAELALLTNSSPEKRLWAVMVAASWRTNVAQTAPVLVALMRDPDVAVRVAATNTLRELDPEALEKAKP